MTWDNPQNTKYIKAVGAYPEGFNIPAYLQELYYRVGILPPEDAFKHTIIDMFCGKGRLAQSVPARHCRVYLGVDINEDAITEAREANPDYAFWNQNATLHSWKADCILLWTAISMLDDEALPLFLGKLDARFIIVGEICGRDWRFNGSGVHPPIYIRDFGETIELFNAAGYALHHHECIPHAHYSNGQWRSKSDTNMHVFVFRKDDDWQFYKDARSK
jgi:hypothetical protein